MKTNYGRMEVHLRSLPHNLHRPSIQNIECNILVLTLNPVRSGRIYSGSLQASVMYPPAKTYIINKVESPPDVKDIDRESSDGAVAILQNRNERLTFPGVSASWGAAFSLVVCSGPNFGGELLETSAGHPPPPAKGRSQHTPSRHGY